MVRVTFTRTSSGSGTPAALRPTAPHDADRQRALLEGTFHRAPVQQLSLTCPTNDPATCSILASCRAVTKAAIALGSIFEDTCTSNAQREPRGASCGEGRYLYKLSEPPCDYYEQCVFAQLNGVCTDHLIGDCALEFVHSLDGKTCDKLQTTAGNVSNSPARPTVNATLPEPLASRTSVRAPATGAPKMQAEYKGPT
ncbi:hypothetical protein HPB49_008163 [Dermacentor silvarum]|uniref:Uncharacterized protein n=1 Tax=Dermacentor silvarum TaxID=543639 RepID=A0ACB8CDV7_DERSI|nr:hypothetical protein HPB49_008163 [Dermacentor silvarum]